MLVVKEMASFFPPGKHARIHGLSKVELNEQYVVSRGEKPDNPERVLVVLRDGKEIAIKHTNLEEAELLPGSRVVVVGIEKAPQYNGKVGEVLSWDKERWIVDMDQLVDGKKERKSFKADNLVILPDRVGKRKAEQEVVEEKRVKDEDLKLITDNDEVKIAKGLVNIMKEHPIMYQKAVCCLATRMQMTIMYELAQHMTDKENDGLLRRIIKPGEPVKGIEELNPLEQVKLIAEKRIRNLAGMIRINHCDLREYIKKGLKEPKFLERDAQLKKPRPPPGVR